MIRRFLRGMASFPRGAVYFLTRPGLWPIGSVPILITVLLFVGFGVGYYILVGGVVDKIQAIPPPPENALSWLGYVPALVAHWLIVHLPRLVWYLLFGLFFLLTTWLTFVTVVNVVAAPWNEALSARVEELCGATSAAAPVGVAQTLADLATGIRHSLLRLFIYWVVYLPLLVLNLIPSGITNVLFLAVGVPWSMLFVAMEFADIPQTRRRLGLREKFRVVFRHRAAMMGFGAAAFLVFMVPVLNVLSIPFAVTGMTLLYREEACTPEI